MDMAHASMPRVGLSRRGPDDFVSNLDTRGIGQHAGALEKLLHGGYRVRVALKLADNVVHRYTISLAAGVDGAWGSAAGATAAGVGN